MKIIPHRLLVLPGAAVADDGPADGTIGRRAVLRVDGLLCDLCAARVQERLEAVEGVRRAAVDLDSGRAEVEYDPSSTGPEDMSAAIDSAVVLRPLRRLMAAASRRLAADRH